MEYTPPRLLMIQSEEHTTFLDEAQHFADSGLRIEGIKRPSRSLKLINENRPDVIILEGPEALEIIKKVRFSRDLDGISLVVIGDGANENVVLEAFECGADDFVARPYSFPILLARIKSLVRRRNALRDPETEKLTLGPLTLNVSTQEAYLDGQVLFLTVTEFRLLRDLASHPKSVRTREVLRSHALSNLQVNDRTIDVHIASLRKKLGAFGDNINTVRGVGYRLLF